MQCVKCKGKVSKNGRQSNGTQRYYCKRCKIGFQETYRYKAYDNAANGNLALLLCSSVGINDIAKIIGISKNTVLRRKLKMGSNVKKPVLHETHQEYELDEMRIVVGRKKAECWIIYAINRSTRQVIDYVVGSRNKENLCKITNSVLRLDPKMVYTDRLPAYKSLIPDHLHDTRKYNTNRIERNNLTIRTHIKRLARKTLCFSKKQSYLEAHLNVYFWGSWPKKCSSFEKAISS